MTEHAATNLFNRIATELALPNYWRLHFDRANRRFGQCNYTLKQINLSRPLVHLNEAKTVEATIRHEIAHALVGPGHSHDAAWRRMAIRCGDDGKRCYGEEVQTPEASLSGDLPELQAETQNAPLEEIKAFWWYQAILVRKVL